MEKIDLLYKQAIEIASLFHNKDELSIQISISLLDDNHGFIAWTQFIVEDELNNFVKSDIPKEEVVGEGSTIENALTDLINSYKQHYFKLNP